MKKVYLFKENSNYENFNAIGYRDEDDNYIYF